MSIQVELRLPHEEPVIRSIVDGCWAEPLSSPSQILGRHMWALPGLVDAHAHLASDSMNFQPGVLADSQRRSREALSAGVILILDKGWTDETVIDVIESVPVEERPDIEAAARILVVEDGYYPGFGRTVTAGAIEETVKDEAAVGAGWVKLAGDWPRRGFGPVANFDESELNLAVRAAEEVGAKVAIHTMAREAPSMAVSAGVHSIEHGLFLSSDDLGVLGSRHGMWVPTVLRTEDIIGELGAESSGGKLLREGLANVRKLLPAAFEAGVSVLAGTDLVGTPADVTAEALRLREYGLSASQVLDTVSISGFRSTGRDHHFGIGSPANAVLFASNPLTDLEVLKHPSGVIRRGRLV